VEGGRALFRALMPAAALAAHIADGNGRSRQQGLDGNFRHASPRFAHSNRQTSATARAIVAMRVERLTAVDLTSRHQPQNVTLSARRVRGPRDEQSPGDHKKLPQAE
jgi:hypothetical protein